MHEIALPGCGDRSHRSGSISIPIARRIVAFACLPFPFKLAAVKPDYLILKAAQDVLNIASFIANLRCKGVKPYIRYRYASEKNCVPKP